MSKPRKPIAELIEELRSWLQNYDHGPDSFPNTFYRIIASLPGGDELEDMGYEPMPGIGWHEADLLGRVLVEIQGKHDVEDLVQGLIRDEEGEVEETRRHRVKWNQNKDGNAWVSDGAEGYWAHFPPGTSAKEVLDVFMETADYSNSTITFTVRAEIDGDVAEVRVEPGGREQEVDESSLSEEAKKRRAAKRGGGESLAPQRLPNGVVIKWSKVPPGDNGYGGYYGKDDQGASYHLNQARDSGPKKFVLYYFRPRAPNNEGPAPMGYYPSLAAAKKAIAAGV